MSDLGFSVRSMIMRWFAGAVLFGVLASCAGKAPPPVQVEPSAGNGAHVASEPKRELLSEPLFPCSTAEGSFPERTSELEALVYASSMPFQQLLEACHADYPQIILPKASEPLAEQQIIKNDSAVADCAYHHYASKPYWVPKLLSEVDVCTVVLGAPWRLPTEADLAAIPEAELQALRDRSKRMPDDTRFYFSLKFYLRTKDGLAEASLDPSRGVRPLSSPSGQLVLERHLEGGIGVRCFRGTGPERLPRADPAPGWSCANRAAKPSSVLVAHPIPPLDPPSTQVADFASYGNKLVISSRGLDIAEARQFLALIRPELERVLGELKEPEPAVADSESAPSTGSKASAERERTMIRYALRKIDARIERERQPDPRAVKPTGNDKAPQSAPPKQRLRELDKLQKVVAELQLVTEG